MGEKAVAVGRASDRRRTLVFLAFVALLGTSVGLRFWLASRSLNAGAHFDERYTLQNVVGLMGGELEPRHAYYTSLSYLPQAAVLAASDGLHRLTGREAFRIFGERRTFAQLRPSAYFLARAVNVVFGALSLWLVFALGRRLDSASAGLVGAAILAAAPRHIVSSALIKPDILVVLLTLAAFWLALDATEAGPERERRAFILAGLAVGLALSAKLTGAIAALPVAAAAFAGAGGSWRALRRSLWSGVAALVVFVALNPFLGAVVSSARLNAAAYAARARQEEGGVLWNEAMFVWRQHGAPVVVFAVLGLAILAHRLWRGERSGRIAAALLLSTIVGWTLLLPLLTPAFRAQNYLPALPFTALAAAIAFAVGWRQVAVRLGAASWGERGLVAAALLASALLLAAQADTTVARSGPVESDG